MYPKAPNNSSDFALIACLYSAHSGDMLGGGHGARAMAPSSFIKKGKASNLKERSAAHEHFTDLCRLLDEAVVQAYAWRSAISDDDMLIKPLA